MERRSTEELPGAGRSRPRLTGRTLVCCRPAGPSSRHELPGLLCTPRASPRARDRDRCVHRVRGRLVRRRRARAPPRRQKEHVAAPRTTRPRRACWALPSLPHHPPPRSPPRRSRARRLPPLQGHLGPEPHRAQATTVHGKDVDPEVDRPRADRGPGGAHRVTADNPTPVHGLISARSLVTRSTSSRQRPWTACSAAPTQVSFDTTYSEPLAPTTKVWRFDP